MRTRNLLYAKEYRINDLIGVKIPSVGDILDDEDNYYNMVSMLTAMPIDLMVQLDDMGIDFTEINEYELFILLSSTLGAMDTSLVFGDLNFSDFRREINPQNNTIVLHNRATGAVIDRAIYTQISGILRKIHHFKKDNRKPGNNDAKEYMIERARKKQAGQNKRIVDSQLEGLIVAMVNTEQFHYGFEGTLELSIYQFNESVRQVVKKVDYDNKMHGIYAGTISVKDINQDDLNWLAHK